MWQAIKIGEQNFFFQCSAEENCIRYYLYNLNEVWSEECSASAAIQRAKDLNKRISYDDETVMKTIKTTKPTTGTLDASEIGRYLQLKYHVVGRPFNFAWKLTLLPIDEVQKLVTFPLFMSIHYLSEQIKELKDTIKKKDLEIEQYKAEGAVLRRTTVATSSFSEETFNKRYEKVNELTAGLLSISDSVKSSCPALDIIETKNECKTKPNGSSSYICNEKLKTKSPIKSKKRKFFETRRLRMENILKAKKETMDYQSTQSQTPPNDELADIFQSLDELNAKRLASSTM